jgi:molybdate transport system substrate-binding protein
MLRATSSRQSGEAPMAESETKPAEIIVMASAAFKEAYLELVPAFERASGHKVTTIWAPSVEMVKRLKNAEMVDLAIMSGKAIEDLVKLGILREYTALARSGVALAVRAGAPRPDISSGGALKQAVLTAKSVGYSTGPSGVYLIGLFERLGIADAIKDKVKQVSGQPVGELVARGEAEIGFQQMSELLPVNGIDIVGPLPDDVQQITTFAAGLRASANSPSAARALVKFLTAPEAAPIIRKKGMEPA